MKWYKHFTDMRHDPKIKRLIREYGVSGYGLYTYIIECIASGLESKSPLPDLEETADDIAYDLKMELKTVEEIILYCVDKELFTVDIISNRIVCGKIYKFLDDATRKNPDIVKMIEDFKKLGVSPSKSEPLGEKPKELRKVLTEEEKKKKRKEEEEEKNYPDEIKNFSLEYQTIVFNEKGKGAIRVTDSLLTNCNDTIDKLIRLDGFTLEDIHKTMMWASNDDFWSGQVFSLASLRKKSGSNGLKKFQNIFNAFKNSGKNNTMQKNITAAEDFVNG